MSAQDRDDVFLNFVWQLQQDQFLAEEILNMEHRPRSKNRKADCEADRKLRARISQAWEVGNYEAIGKIIAKLYDESFELACDEAGV